MDEERIEKLELAYKDLYSGQLQATARLVVLESAFARLAAQLAKASPNPEAEFETFVSGVEAEFQKFQAEQGPGQPVSTLVGRAVDHFLMRMRQAYTPPPEDHR